MTTPVYLGSARLSEIGNADFGIYYRCARICSLSLAPSRAVQTLNPSREKPIGSDMRMKDTDNWSGGSAI